MKICARDLKNKKIKAQNLEDLYSDEIVSILERQEKQTSVIIEIIGSADSGYVAKIVKPDASLYSDFGVQQESSGRSGWEALQQMAENFRRTGFLD